MDKQQHLEETAIAGSGKITVAGLTRVQIKEIEHFIADDSVHSRVDKAIAKSLTRNKTEERKDQNKDQSR